MRISRICTAALALTLVTGLAMAQDKVTLKLNLKENEAWKQTQTMTMDMKMKVSAGGQEQNIDQTMEMKLNSTMKPLAIKDGAPTKSEIEFGNDATITMKMMGRTQNIPFPLAGKKMTVTKKDDGSIEIDPAGAVDPQNQSMLKDMMDSAKAFYPEKPVGTGDKWEVTGDKVAKMFQMEQGATGKITCTMLALKKVDGRQVADVDMDGKVAGKMQGMLDVSVDMKGPMSIDVASGQVLSQDVTANMTMNGAQGAGDQQVKMSGTGTIKISQKITPAGK